MLVQETLFEEGPAPAPASGAPDGRSGSFVDEADTASGNERGPVQP